MKIFRNFFLLFVLYSGMAAAQDTIIAKPLSAYDEDQLKTDEFGQKYYYDERQKAKIYDINGETVVVMDELLLRKNPRFNNQLDRNYYYFLNKKLNRVYPLFLTALEQYRDVQSELNSMSKADQKKFMKVRQNELASQYEAQLRDLTVSEGRVFAKLMSRATGKTVFEIIKELRGGWSAFWWNVKGNIADVDLKDPYDPYRNRTDLFVESLLQSNWNYGYLQPYPGASTYTVKK
ncbi:DUF4294 domain-containing protein [Chryseobacterium sp. MFBS3-17]|uniref:DUF4294 domain-containing protein n=1 Tax=Chryseobacterium sp. MFBS3-17 TaxID=2886689 RepID=UPI001D0E7EE2|nr:DUF4294 domain-containing protein [Chryseobacterium sp. MFBS3-17]MCC2591537.1 DUF4294 domain-containing protein [Chryseobacterium sp. MFBS3-17]